MRIFVQDQAYAPEGHVKKYPPRYDLRDLSRYFHESLRDRQAYVNIPSIYSPPNFGELIF
jgi:hypothetical protein